MEAELRPKFCLYIKTHALWSACVIGIKIFINNIKQFPTLSRPGFLFLAFCDRGGLGGPPL